MTRPRCHCGSTLSASAAGFTCPRCHRVYLDGATLPACKHVRIDRQYVADGISVACLECGRSWREIPISEVTT